MPAAIVIRKDYSSAELRRLARSSKSGQEVRRRLALAALIDGANRTEAAKVGGMERQTLRDWVHRFNADGPSGLINLKAPGSKRKLTKAQRTKLAKKVELGPISAVDGVVRWRLVDCATGFTRNLGWSSHPPRSGGCLRSSGIPI